MAVGYERITRATITSDESAELETVDALAQRLRLHLDASEMAIEVAHVHAAKSGAIQAIAAAVLTKDLGFREEIVLAPEQGFTIRARPDFIFRLADGRGVLAEVERGGTTTNNHDLKDFWKTHIAQDAHHLFLIVPNSNWKEDGAPREKPFKHVCRRLRAFFGDARREVDVLSVHIFGYGREA